MEIRSHILYVVLGGAVVTWLPRVVPLLVLNRFTLPQWVMRFLGYIPVSAMAALLAQEVLVPNGKLNLSPYHNPGLIAVVPTFAVAVATRSLIGTVVTGVACMLVLHFLLPLL